MKPTMPTDAGREKDQVQRRPRHSRARKGAAQGELWEIPREVVVDNEIIAVLDAIEDYEGDDYDAELLALAGFDESSLREFFEKTGRMNDPVAQSLLVRFSQQATGQEGAAYA